MFCRIPVLVLALAGGAALPAAAPARIISYGSSLRASANRVEAHGADTAFWPTVSSRGRSVRAPATGQILRIRLKGTVLRRRGHDPLNEVHFQHLVRLGGGRMLVSQTSGPFRVPIGGRRNTISTFRPENLCVRRGDVIAFNDEGGFAPPFFSSGSPFRVFARVHRGHTAQYTRSGGTLNDMTLYPTVRRHEELLMRLTMGTGRQEGGACRAFNRGG